MNISSPLKLRCGITLANRIVKAALAEAFCTPSDPNPNEKFYNLYKTWAKGGAGMLLTGHIMVDRN